MNYEDPVEEELEEIPWGPGVIELLKPMTVNIFEDEEGDNFEIIAVELDISAAGYSYEEALINLGVRIEEILDDAEDTPKHKRHSSLVKVMQRILEYIPAPEQR